MMDFHHVSNFASVALMNALTLLPFRFYEKAEESKLPKILKDCMALFRSEAMFLLLSNFTGLKLHFLAPSEEDELEDKKEGEAASPADNTEEGTSHSSFEPENRREAISDSSQQSNEQIDPEPEETKAKKGKLFYSVPIFSMGIHDSFNKYFSSTYYMLSPVSRAGVEDRQGLCSPEPIF